jgi:hypothetical protein
MAAGPQRRKDPVPHLMAHIAPVERALNERARMLEIKAAEVAIAPLSGDVGAVYRDLAAEFRALAEELHHW